MIDSKDERQTPCGRAESPELAIDHALLLSTLRGLVQRFIVLRRVEGTGDGNAGMLDKDLDAQLEALWDLCVDPRTAAFLVKHHAVAVLTETVPHALEAEDDGARCAEVCLGALGNICSHHAVVASLIPDDIAALASTAVVALHSPCGSIVLQALRVSCALLGGPCARRVAVLWDQATVARYMLVLENSLLWEAVQLSCDNLSELLRLAADVGEHSCGTMGGSSAAPGSAVGNSGGCNGSGSDAAAGGNRCCDCDIPEGRLLVGRLVDGGMLGVLTARINELVAAAGGETADAEEGEVTETQCGDIDAALLSSLRLGESFLAMSSCAVADAGNLAAASLHVLAAMSRPEVLVAALELLSSTLDVDDDDAELVFARVQNVIGGRAGAGIVENMIDLLQDEEALEESVADTVHRVLRRAPQHLLTNVIGVAHAVPEDAQGEQKKKKKKKKKKRGKKRILKKNKQTEKKKKKSIMYTRK
eukprot:NODE_7220_length_1598_cov_8.684568.p1 GENE.NODE_7220_length_1598_cov_8.684568~~NODE_7220_length_1598_cov_8.684568.p1  ORF type:complete len:476 (+),score=135.42 NODE_7220_length_1598_cov_8.684568:127-1554(+)